MSKIIFDEERLALLDKLYNWWKERPADKDTAAPHVFVYSGKAGTGKTTIIKYFIKKIGLTINEYIAVALSGKASTVLSSHDLPSSTIHSLIYDVVTDVVYDENGMPIMKDDGTPVKRMVFSKKDKIPESIKLIIVDELSMVNDEIMEDLLSYGVPIIGMGDLNQLPPIFGISSWMLKPDHVLQKIMRQEENNPIIYMANCILEGKPLTYGDYGKSRVLKKIEMDVNLLTDYDIILCANNKSRDIINNYIRKFLLNLPSPYPIIGDKMICRNNDRGITAQNYYLTNGTLGRIEFDGNESKNSNSRLVLNLIPDFANICFRDIEIDLKYLYSDFETRKHYGLSKYAKFEYGYAITVHLSQGSQYNRVLYIDEPFGGINFRKALRYTAITRAVKNIDIVTAPIEYLIPDYYRYT